MLKKLHKIAAAVLSLEKSKGKVIISITDDKTIRTLNKKYRKIDRATDVLSFFMGEDGVLGDIIISEQTAKNNSKRYKTQFNDELKRLVIHGTLHLLGYDHHQKTDRIKMRSKEDLYAKTIY